MADPLGFDDRRIVLGPDLLSPTLMLHDLQTKTFGDVEGDVAVNEPGSRVVGFEGNHDVAAAWHEHDVASRRIVEPEVHVADTKIFVVCLFKESEIVAM